MTRGKFVRMKLERARELKAKRSFEEAEVELREALEEAPEDALVKSSLADLHMRRRNLFEARVLAEEVLAADPQDARAMTVLGMTCFKEKNFEEALELFAQASVRDSGAFLAVQTARTLKELGRLDEALETVDSVLASKSNSALLLKEKALILTRMRRSGEALRVYQRLSELAPGDRFVRKEILRLQSLDRPGQEVVSELRAVTRMESGKNDAQLHAVLGQKLKETGQVREAVAEYRTASELEPDNLYFLKQRGFCHYRAGDLAEAEECLAEAFKRDPSDFIVRKTLERICSKRGRLRDFLALLEEALRLHPENKKLLGPIARIGKLLEEGQA